MGVVEFILENLRDIKGMSPIFPIRYAAYCLGRPTVSMNIRNAGMINFRPTGSDIEVLRSVFRSRDYDLSAFPQGTTIRDTYNRLLSKGKVPIIVDAGANIGASSIWFARSFPAAQVVAIEPEPENAKICRVNTAALGNVTVLEAALGATQGKVDLRDVGEGSWAFRTERNPCGSVPVSTMSDVEGMIPNGTLFVVKVDIEGFESEVFSGDTSWMDRVTALIIEPHDWMLPGRKTSRPLQKAVARLDFDILISGENLVYVRAPS